MSVLRHGTLSADEVTTISLPGNFTTVEVLNRDGTAEIWFTVDGPVPTIAGDDVDVLPAAISGLEVSSPSFSDTVVRLLSSGTPKYTVKVLE